MPVESRAEQAVLSPANLAVLRNTLGSDVTRMQDALNDRGQNPAVYEQIRAVVQQNQRLLGILSNIEQRFAQDPAHVDPQDRNRYSTIVGYVLRNHPEIESALQYEPQHKALFQSVDVGRVNIGSIVEQRATGGPDTLSPQTATPLSISCPPKAASAHVSRLRGSMDLDHPDTKAPTDLRPNLQDIADSDLFLAEIMHTTPSIRASESFLTEPIYDTHGALIEPNPRHARQVLYELAKQYREQLLAAKDGKLAALQAENAALKTNLHAALTEITDLKARLSSSAGRLSIQEDFLTAENTALKETITRKSADASQLAQEMQALRAEVADLKCARENLTQLTSVLLQERQALQNEIIQGSRANGDVSRETSLERIEAMCRHAAALEQQIQTQPARTDLCDTFMAKLELTIQTYETMLGRVKQLTGAQLNDLSVTLSPHASMVSILGVPENGGTTIARQGREPNSLSTGQQSHQDPERTKSQPRSTRSPTRSKSGTTGRNGRQVSPDVLVYEVVRVLTELGPRAPALQRVGPREWIVEKNGIVISVNLNSSGIVVVESEGGVPLVQFLKRMHDVPARLGTPGSRSPRRPRTSSVSTRSPGFNALSMFDTARKIMDKH
ncbi:hypothetical protein GMRT_14648 [Giardia muris]|uniref:Uncharacterized protein n=1 Tax=Giardia muris TaxID=5742 RepID=A0A4Z1SMT5_GIAMU|nr:hypothetical protein GMRT_14648 [Giardia muris]|eukprot:TNJ27032.1 hypothetical protein GMRT_14648 [Giardia muris]